MTYIEEDKKLIFPIMDYVTIKFPVEFGANEVYSPSVQSTGHVQNPYIYVKNQDLLNIAIDDNSFYIKNILTYKHTLNPPGYYQRGCELLNSSLVLYNRSAENQANELLQFPNIHNGFSEKLLYLESRISSEVRLLSEQEAKWSSLLDFAEEYKEVFEISDEELWFEFGNELNNITYELSSIKVTKQLFYVTTSYLRSTRKILSRGIRGFKLNRICNLRYQVAFSTKNLDDEHHSIVKTIEYQVFTNLRIVYHEEININKAFTVCLQDGFADRAERSYQRGNQTNQKGKRRVRSRMDHNTFTSPWSWN
jgi:hypothetical protein